MRGLEPGTSGVGVTSDRFLGRGLLFFLGLAVVAALLGKNGAEIGSGIEYLRESCVSPLGLGR